MSSLRASMPHPLTCLFPSCPCSAVPEDINWYLADSEQREGALAAGVFVQGTDDGVDRNGKQLGGAKVLASGGWYVQLLPFAADAAVEQLQKNLAAMANRSPTTMIREGLSPEAVVNLLLDGLDPQIVNPQPGEAARGRRSAAA